jgi:type I restriction enzyme M protein
MHILHSLAVNGTAAIVEFPGVMYRGGAEQKIRKYLIDNNYVDAVIQLPQDLFFGTSIATCILVLKKSKKENSTLFVDASALFTREQTKNKLMSDHMSRILETVEKRSVEDHYSIVVDNTDVAANDYNLSVASYVVAEDRREVIDIKQLNKDIGSIVARQSELRQQIDAIVADLEGSK